MVNKGMEYIISKMLVKVFTYGIDTVKLLPADIDCLNQFGTLKPKIRVLDIWPSTWCSIVGSKV